MELRDPTDRAVLHSTATIALGEDVAVAVVRQTLGHSSIRSVWWVDRPSWNRPSWNRPNLVGPRSQYSYFNAD